jgi:hypothetical protein
VRRRSLSVVLLISANFRVCLSRVSGAFRSENNINRPAAELAASVRFVPQSRSVAGKSNRGMSVA